MLKCLVNLWFYGLRIVNFGLDMYKVTKFNVIMAMIRSWKSIKVSYQPQEKCGRKYHVVRFPLFNVSDTNMKLLKCEEALVLMWNE